MFTPFHRGGGGCGPPLVLLHGFMDTWRTWELVLPALERRHDVLALTMLGHAGGPPLEGEVDDAIVADAVERAMDEAGFDTAHVAGNSMGGFVALQLAERGRARSVVALAPAGGWAPRDPRIEEVLRTQAAMHAQARAAAPHAATLVSTPEGRRRATRLLTVEYEHIPAELLEHLTLGVAGCRAAPAMVEFVLRGATASLRREDRLPGADRVGHGGPDPAVAVDRAALPRASGCRTPTGCSSTASATTPSSTSRCETAQLILGSRHRKPRRQ